MYLLYIKLFLKYYIMMRFYIKLLTRYKLLKFERVG